MNGAASAETARRAPACRATVESLIQEQLHRSTSRLSWWRRWGVARKLKERQARILKRIESAIDFDVVEVYDQQVLATAISEAVEAEMADLGASNARSLGLFIGTIASAAAVNVFLHHALDATSAAFFSQSLTVLTATLISAIGAPIVLPMAAAITRWAWKRGKKVVLTPQAQKVSEFFAQANETTNQVLEQLEQSGRSVAYNALTQVKLDVQACLLMMTLSAGKNQGLDVCANHFALSLVNLETGYFGLDLAHPFFAAWPRTDLVPFLDAQSYARFHDAVLKGIRMSGTDERETGKYERIMRAWFQPGVQLNGIPKLPRPRLPNSEVTVNDELHRHRA